MTHAIPQNVFTSSASTANPVPLTGGAVALPAVDSANVSMLVSNTTGASCQFQFQQTNVNLMPAPITIYNGQSLLFGSTAPVDFPATQASIATFAAVSTPGGGALAFARGTIVTTTVYQ